eukprot:GEMP01001318.1.p1 GENE.GEMP01001318.1~~GEMP01001318.1.p1  ORF type:complete len:1664 (+),score=313.68 GEMP01001318.1:503-5494(+)
MPVIPVSDFTDGLKGSADQAFHAMEKMREMLRSDPEDGLDLLNGYVQHSPTCCELLDQIERSDFLDGDKAHVFAIDLLCRIMDGQFMQTPRTESTKTSVSVMLLEELKVLYRLLNTDNNYYLKTCLRCLSHMANLTAPLLIAEFNFDYKPFSRLVARRTRGDPSKNVRSFYLLLAKTLLQSPDSAVVIDTLRIPKYIQPIFKLLCDDFPPHALEFISVLHKNILDNRRIPRGLKKQLFNWSGIRYLTTLLEHRNEELADKAFAMLLQYLTSTFFFRAHPREANALFNLCSKTRPLHKRQQKLILGILQAHPQVYVSFTSMLSLGMYPRISLPWLWNLRFVSSLLRMNRSEADDRAALESAPAFEFCMPPKTMNKTFLTQGIFQAEYIVCDATISLLESVLIRARALSALLDENTLALFRRQLLVTLPDLVALISLARPLSQRPIRTLTADDDITMGDSASTAAEVAQSGKSEEKNDYSDDVHGKGRKANDDDTREARQRGHQVVPFLEGDCFVQWANCVRLYVEVLPLSLRDCKFDWTKILVMDKALLTSDRSLALLRLVEATFVSDGRFLGGNLPKPQQAYLHYLLDATVLGVVEAEQALRRLLRTFAIFDDTEVELGMWIEQLREFPECAPFFAHCVIHLMNQPGHYISMAHEIHQLYPEDRPSLCYLTAVHQHSLGFPKNVDGTPLLNAVASRLALVNPRSSAGMMRVVKHFHWNEKKEKKRSLRTALMDPESASKRIKHGLCGFVSLVQSGGSPEHLETALREIQLGPAEIARALLCLCDAMHDSTSFKQKLFMATLVPEEWMKCLPKAPPAALRLLATHPCWDAIDGVKSTARAYRSAAFSILADVLAIQPMEEGYARLLECLKVTPDEFLARKAVVLSVKTSGWKEQIIGMIPQVEEPLVLIQAFVAENVGLSEIVGLFSSNVLTNDNGMLKTLLLVAKTPACWVHRLHHLLTPDMFSLDDDSALFVTIARLSSKFREHSIKLKDRFLHRLALMASFINADDIELLETDCNGLSEDLLRGLLQHHPRLATKLHATEVPVTLCLAEVRGAAEQREALETMDNVLLARWLPRFSSDAKKGLQVNGITIELALVMPGDTNLDVFAPLFAGDDELSSKVLQLATKLWPRVQDDTSWKRSVLTKIQSSYRGSLSEDDTARCSLLMIEAKKHDNWEFHLIWPHFDWSLDGIRLRDTLDTFFASEKGPDVYDLSYLLPFFYARLLTAFSTDSLPLRLVCQGGVLQVLLYGLATEWRKWAYQGLMVVDAALQKGWQKDHQNRMAFREVPQITLLLESLRNAIPAPESGYPRLAPLICAFMASAVGIMLRPEHSLYLDVGRFFITRPHIDVEDVPMFYQLFYSERSEDRKWIIKVLRRGGPNWSIFARRHMVQSILSFAGSTLCDFGTWADCLRFLGTLRPGAGMEFGSGRLEDFGVSEWIIGETRKPYGNEKLETIALGKLIDFLGSVMTPSADSRRCDVTGLMGAALSLAESTKRLRNIPLAQKLWPVVLSMAKIADPTELGHHLLLCFKDIVPLDQWPSTFTLDTVDVLGLCRLCPASDIVRDVLATQQVMEQAVPVQYVISALQALLGVNQERPVERDAILFFLTIRVTADIWKIHFLCAVLLLRHRDIPDNFLDLPHPLEVEEIDNDHSSQAFSLFQLAIA